MESDTVAFIIVCTTNLCESVDWMLNDVQERSDLRYVRDVRKKALREILPFN